MTQRVLIVDDSKATRSMVAFTLRRAGYDVAEAENGRQALAAIEDSRFDLLIADVNMPEMNGFEMVRLVRGNAAYRTTPVLMLTTMVDIASKDRAREAGVTGWLGKPFLPADLIESVSRVI